MNMITDRAIVVLAAVIAYNRTFQTFRVSADLY